MHPESGWVRTVLVRCPDLFRNDDFRGSLLRHCSKLTELIPGPLKWIKEILFLPILLALGIGMSVNNGKAVLEALFSNNSEFVRTPKYGIEKKDKKRTRSHYKALKSFAPIFELLFFGYFTYLVINAWQTAQLSSFLFNVISIRFLHCSFWIFSVFFTRVIKKNSLIQ